MNNQSNEQEPKEGSSGFFRNLMNEEREGTDNPGQTTAELFLLEVNKHLRNFLGMHEDENRRLQAENQRLKRNGMHLCSLYTRCLASEKDEHGNLIRPDFSNPNIQNIMTDLISGQLVEDQLIDVVKAYRQAVKILN